MSAIIETIYKYDSLISYRLGDLKSHRWLRDLMVISSKLGDGSIWLFLSLSLLLFGGIEGQKAVLIGTISVILCVAIFKAIKHSTTRKRPFETYVDMEFILPPPDEYSFPSGHSINAFAIATAAAWFFPLLFIPLFVMASLIAISRVFLSLHYPTDVIVGGLIGIGVSSTLIWVIG
ncbi:MAG: phosphatase PAP2 family protein [Deltaproteobacteria bacterium]|nr:phosphatase PAP2 family protein [Deltaproteobacteria bacterium]